MSTPRKAARLPDDLVERIEAFQLEHNIKTFSDALRFVLKRGLLDVERKPDPAPAARRRILSPGVR